MDLQISHHQIPSFSSNLTVSLSNEIFQLQKQTAKESIALSSCAFGNGVNT